MSLCISYLFICTLDQIYLKIESNMYFKDYELSQTLKHSYVFKIHLLTMYVDFYPIQSLMMRRLLSRNMHEYVLYLLLLSYLSWSQSLM